MSALAAGLVGLAGTPASANGCGLIDRDRADKAVEILRRAERIIFDDWFNPITVHTVKWVRVEFLYRVVVNESVALNLSRTYLSGKGKSFHNLGPKVDCGTGNLPRTIAAAPFREASGVPPGPYPGRADPYRVHRNILGLLDMATISVLRRTGRSAGTIPISIYAEPSKNATVHKVAERWDGIEAREFGYEESGAVVLETRPGWYRIGLQRGTGWVAATDTGAYYPYEKLVTEGLSHVTPDWNGRLWENPGGAGKARDMAPGWRRHLGKRLSIDVTESRRIDERLWFRVQILWPGACSSGKPRVIAEGWVPAYGPRGHPTTWFWSRGC